MLIAGKHNKILVAPLNWGLGHAVRCIPIINALLDDNFKPILAGDGPSLELLKKEFPLLTFYELPSYRIEYATTGRFLKVKLFFQLPKILRAVAKERKIIDQIVEKEHVKGIISDNRFGARSDKIPSVYMTHQLHVLSGTTSYLTTLIHQKVISKFNECWVPDYGDQDSLAGELSRTAKSPTKVQYVGPLSRFSEKNVKKDIDILVVLSGPEPQRGILERKLIKELKSFKGKCLMVKGVVEEKQQVEKEGKITMVNFMLSEELEETLHRSSLVISRSGYSSIMDLEAIKAKAFFVPTPGQFEQEYLAKRMKKLGIADFADQDEFRLDQLQSLDKYVGFGHKKTSKTNLSKSLFDVFK